MVCDPCNHSIVSERGGKFGWKTLRVKRFRGVVEGVMTNHWIRQL